VGEGRRKLLLRHFGSVRRVREATIEELAEVLGPVMAERVHAALHGHEGQAPADPMREASLSDAGAPLDASAEDGESDESGSPAGVP
jgi:excinuclease ABC subunit C